MGPAFWLTSRGGYWALTSGGPLSLAFPCGQGTRTLPALSRCAALLSSLIYLKSHSNLKSAEKEMVILYFEICLSKGTYH